MQQYVYAFIVAERIMTRVIRPWLGAQQKMKGLERGWKMCLFAPGRHHTFETFSAIVASPPMLNNTTVFTIWLKKIAELTSYPNSSIAFT